jgi:hypothetical protein
MRTDNAGRQWAAGQCLARMRAPAAVSLAAGGGGFVLAANGFASTVDGGKAWTWRARSR